VFRNKINNKYNIENINSKTYEEILNNINDEKRQDIKEIIDIFYKIKYS
jgi:hypothetical protein